jgi:hypothetical protein
VTFFSFSLPFDIGMTTTYFTDVVPAGNRCYYYQNACLNGYATCDGDDQGRAILIANECPFFAEAHFLVSRIAGGRL